MFATRQSSLWIGVMTRAIQIRPCEDACGGPLSDTIQAAAPRLHMSVIVSELLRILGAMAHEATDTIHEKSLRTA